MPSTRAPTLRTRFLRFAFHHFYNSFAWTYDTVSATISLGHWREWTRAAIPHLRGPRILEIAFGTGNLQLDMRATGFAPFGIDLSANMVRMTVGKLRRAGYPPRITRGSVLGLPFASASFNSVVLTFPPNFLGSAPAIQEMRRVLADDGRLILVDAGWLQEPAALSALINLAFRFTGTADVSDHQSEPLRRAGFDVQVTQAGDARSRVQVLIAEKVVRR